MPIASPFFYSSKINQNSCFVVVVVSTRWTGKPVNPVYSGRVWPVYNPQEPVIVIQFIWCVTVSPDPIMCYRTHLQTGKTWTWIARNTGEKNPRGKKNHCNPWEKRWTMVSMLDSRSSSLGLSTGRGYCDVSLGKTLNSHSASLHPGINGYWRTVWETWQNAGGITCDGLASHPGGVVILSVSSVISSALWASLAHVQHYLLPYSTTHRKKVFHSHLKWYTFPWLLASVFVFRML